MAIRRLQFWGVWALFATLLIAFAPTIQAQIITNEPALLAQANSSEAPLCCQSLPRIWEGWMRRFSCRFGEPKPGCRTLPVCAAGIWARLTAGFDKSPKV